MVISLGRLNVPIILFSSLLPFLLTVIFLQFYLKDKKERSFIINKISNIIFLTFIIWKLTPIISNFKTIIDDPSSFLFMSGGIYGEIAGIIGALIYLTILVLKNREDIKLISFASIVVVLFITILIIFNNIEPSSISDKNRLEVSELTILNMKNEITSVNFDESKPIIINFWATWCPPCKAEIPDLISFYAEEGKNVNFYGVNLINTEKADIKGFIDSYNINFPIYLDNKNLLSEYFEVETIPSTIIITKVKNKWYFNKISGVISSDSLKRLIN
ncbi:MAG: TlpA family protein disulfide reductase [Spirochaetaceae bacterium]